MYTETKTLLKDIKEDRTKWKDITCSLTRNLNIVKLEKCPISMHRFYTIPVKTSNYFSVENDKLILNLIWKYNEPQIAKQS